MSEESVLVSRDSDEVAVVTLNRPARLNALTHEMVASLHAALGDLGADRSCRVVILTGAGRGFCAGLDLTGPGVAPGAGDAGAVERRMLGQQHIATLVTRMRSMRQPIIAAVNGPASGGGLALALAADIRVAAASAVFNVAFVRIGLSGCDIGVSWLLPRAVGTSHAFEMMLTGRRVDATEAERIGLVSRTVADGECVAWARATAGDIVANSPFGVWMTKEVMWTNVEAGSLGAAVDLENRTQILATFTGAAPDAIL